MRVVQTNITRHKTTTAKVRTKLETACPGRFFIHDKHRHDGETIFLIYFKDDEAATLARMFDVPMNDQPVTVSPDYLDRLAAAGVIPWEQV